MISSTVNSFRNRIFTVLKTEVALETNSLHSFSTEDDSSCGRAAKLTLPEVHFSFLTCFFKVWISSAMSLMASFSENNSLEQ